MDGAENNNLHIEADSAEAKLRDALIAGKPCTFEDGTPDNKRTIDATILARLLRGEWVMDGKSIAMPRKVVIKGAKITGTLDMSDTKTGLHLQIHHSQFDTQLDFRLVHFARIDFTHCDLAGGNFNDAKIDSDLWMKDVHCEGALSLGGANIGGQFNANSKTRRATFKSADTTINAQGAVMQDGVFLRGVKITGTADFKSTKIGGQFSASSTDTHRTEFINPEGHAINTQGAKIQGGVFLRGTKITGSAAFNTTKIGGHFLGSSTKRHRTEFINPKGKAITAQGTTIQSNVLLRGVKIIGIAAFNGVKIIGQFSASSTAKHRTEFINPNGNAINAQGAVIKSDTFLDGAKIIGTTDFNGAKINGKFSASSTPKYCAEFITPNGKAINAQGVEIKDSIVINRTKFRGKADFNRATVNGEFWAKGTSFIALTGKALQLQSAHIKAATVLTDFPHPPIGTLDFTSAHLEHLVIDGDSYPLGVLNLNGTTYTNIDDNRKSRDICEGWLTPIKNINIRRKNGQTAYEVMSKASKAGILSLKDGKTIHDIINEHVKAAEHHTRHPFAYRQYAKVLDANGHEREARKVRYHAAQHLTERTAKNHPGLMRHVYRPWRFILKITTGYGEYLQYAGYWLIALLASGTLFFSIFTDDTGDMVPSRERFYLSEAYQSYISDGELPEGYPHFNGFIYSLDVMLPIVDLAQESHWRPRNVSQGTNFVRNYNRFHLLFGWFLSTIGLAGLTGLLRDKKET